MLLLTDTSTKLSNSKKQQTESDTKQWPMQRWVNTTRQYIGVTTGKFPSGRPSNVFQLQLSVEHSVVQPALGCCCGHVY